MLYNTLVRHNMQVLLDDQDGGADENILLEGGARFGKDAITGRAIILPISQLIIPLLQ